MVSAGIVDTDKTLVAVLRPDGSDGEQKEVLSNFTVWPGLIVRVSTLRQHFGEQEQAIVGVDYDTYAASSTRPSLIEKHGQKHGFEQQDEVVWLHEYQLYPLRVQPYSGLTVRVLGGKGSIYYADGSWRELINSLDVDLTPSKPVSGERWVMMSLTATGSVTLTNGTAAATVLRSSIPDPPTGEFPVAAVKIASADTAIVRGDIDDLRHKRPFVEDRLPVAYGSAWQRLRMNSGGTALEYFTDGAGISTVIGGAGVDIVAGDGGRVIVPINCKVIGWWITGDNAANQIVVDVKLDSPFPTGGALPSASSIAGSEKPTLYGGGSGAGSNSDLSLTTWTTQVLAPGDVLEFYVDSTGGTIPQKVEITLLLEKR